jgi:hypothetical protein
MSEQASIIQENADFLFTRLQKTIEGLTQEESNWKPTPESNNIVWQLNHLSRIINLNMPRLIKEDKEWSPKNWDPNYKEAVTAIEKLVQDIEQGKLTVLPELGNLSKDQLEKEVKYWGGTRKQKEGLFAYLAEIAHHKGQIAYIRATYARLQGNKWKYP